MVETFELFGESSSDRAISLCSSTSSQERSDGLLSLLILQRNAESLTGLGVSRMRAAGDSWQTIGEVLGISRQAAQQRWGRRADKRRW